MNKAKIPVMLIGLLSVAGLLAQTAQTTKKPVTRKPAVKATESKEHAAIRSRYEAKVKECEGDKPQSTDNPEFDKVMRRLNAQLVVSRAKLAAVGKSEGEKEVIMATAEMQLHSCEASELLVTQLEHVDSCVTIYHKTIDKRASDLTVRESEQVKACQSLDLYPPNR
jgi:hypothetical protein